MLLVTPLLDVHVTSPYGMRDLDHDGEETLHAGVDLRAPVGTPLYAMGDGIVRAAGQGAGGRDGGIALDVVDDDDGRLVYLHLSRPAVVTGQRVRAGQVIGFSGATGVVAGPHLHLQWQPLWPAGQTADIAPVLATLDSPLDVAVDDGDGAGVALLLLFFGGAVLLSKRKR